MCVVDINSHVVMIQHTLAGKYRSRPHPGSENVRATCGIAGDRYRIACHLLGDNDVDHAVCLIVEFLLHTVLSTKMARSTQL